VPASNPALMHLRRFAAVLIKHLGLSGLAFRAHEFITTRRLARASAAAFRTNAADGLPLPPASYMVLVGGETSVDAFLQGGAVVVEVLRDMLAAAGADLAQCRSILDFGCGCGRVIRHLRPFAQRTAISGTDYNPRLLAWCREHLPFAQFALNDLHPPLTYGDGAFDLIYAFSVFTHLSAPLQIAWMREMERVLAPGGYLFVTVHGESFRAELDDQERRAFARGELVVRHAFNAGSNLCTAFHPETYLRSLAAPGLEIVGYAPARLGQDAVLLRKR
jgi:SAM-dependent methyltransferase